MKRLNVPNSQTHQPGRWPRLLLWELVGLVLLTAGAGCFDSAPRTCQTRDDCFQGERCPDNVCIPVEEIDSGADTDSTPTDTNGDTDGDIDVEDTTVDSATDTAEPEDAGGCETECPEGRYCHNGKCVDPCNPRKVECGEVPAGDSGNTANCGGCNGQESTCIDNTCKDVCSTAFADCGELFWGGETVPCGQCQTGQQCVQNRCTEEGWRALALGREHSCGIKHDGALYCWGDDGDGQLGTGSNQMDQSGPVRITGPTGNPRAISALVDHTCIQQEGGEVFCWGKNDTLQSGKEVMNQRISSPTRFGQISDAATVTAGYQHSCVGLTSGDGRCWGNEGQGKLGDGSTDETTNARVPVDIERLDAIVELAAGRRFTCALETDGSVWCWGSGNNGQLGNGEKRGQGDEDPVVQATPVEVDLVEPIIDLDAGYSHACAVDRAGQIHCWGAGADYQLGNEKSSREAIPVEVKQSDWKAHRVSCGSSFTCALSRKGLVYCWGKNMSGLLGDGQSTSEAQKPTAALDKANDVVDIEAGDEHICAIKQNGEAYCWGNSLNGKLGGGTDDPSDGPVKVK